MWIYYFILISKILLLILLLPLSYLLLMAIGAIRSASRPQTYHRTPLTRFMIVIPAHNEADVIGATVKRLNAIDYPSDLYSIHVVADHCSDDTAEAARRAGALVYERSEGTRSGKGAALFWLLKRILENDQCDAVVIFDADTMVDPAFLRVMDWRLAQGDQVIQGQHIICNPDQGWFPALTWAMFLIDNRFQNLGRTNLGWSAKNMGDSICFSVDVLRKVGWGEGLTEDYHLRLKLLLCGIRIVYEPAAIGYGEAPLDWGRARNQRARWLRGTTDASRKIIKRLIVEGMKNHNMAMLDGAFQASFPSYSTLSVVSLIVLAMHVPIDLFINPLSLWPNICAWAVMVGMLVIYPMIGLALERAPLKAYFVILSGPYFIFWRTWVAVLSRFGRKPVSWIRTEHGDLKL
jgi:cellulose synthase/poly-beta-1,6-N-acetylglucosamine synthase-like glycosyltransferase